VSGEDQNTEFKSLRLLTRDKPDWAELARDCVGFANAQGGGMLVNKPREPLLKETALIVDRTSIEWSRQSRPVAASRLLRQCCDIAGIVQIPGHCQ
jgi:hypothetical protein